MAKRKREGIVCRLILKNYFTDIGLPEVDRLMYGGQFRKFQPTPPSFSRISVPKEVNRMKKGRKLWAHPCTKTSSLKAKSTEEEDRISTMPDDILQHIISSLTVREGAATSVVSTRWRYLWTASFSCLNFNVANMRGCDYPDDFLRRKGRPFYLDKKAKFVRWVNNVLELRAASRLDALRVSFFLDKACASHVDTWIESAVAQGVTDIELDFDWSGYVAAFRYRDSYEFPAQRVASSVKYLHLNNCIFRLSPDFVGFTSLVTLSLSEVLVNQSIVDTILSKSPLLQFLSLASCKFETSTSLKFGGPSFVLKHLHIGSTSGTMEVELGDINLLSFELGGMWGRLTIHNAPHLARLMLCTSIPIQLLSDLPYLQTLFLCEGFKESSMPKMSVFNSLKRLVFTANFGTTHLCRVVSLLEACHLLQELEIEMGIVETNKTEPLSETMMRRLTTASPLNNLKEIEIYGFHTLPKRIEFAKYLLKNAIVLEKMKIYTISKIYCANGKCSFYETIAKHKISLEEVCKMLQTLARPSTQLELFGYLNL